MVVFSNLPSYWHILAGVRVFGSLSDHDTLLLRYHDPNATVHRDSYHFIVTETNSPTTVHVAGSVTTGAFTRDLPLWEVASAR
jgi:hypothetical protein